MFETNFYPILSHINNLWHINFLFNLRVQIFFAEQLKQIFKNLIVFSRELSLLNCFKLIWHLYNHLVWLNISLPSLEESYFHTNRLE